MAGGDFAGITPGGGPLNAPRRADLDLYEHIEGLCGQEEALLQIPAADREAHHHERLRALEHELDRAFERLRHRHERRGAADA